MLILVYTIHQPFVHMCTKFQCYSFHSSGEICDEKFSLMVNYKTYHVTPRVMGLCPRIPVHTIHQPTGYVCTKLQLCNLTVLKKYKNLSDEDEENDGQKKGMR